MYTPYSALSQTESKRLFVATNKGSYVDIHSSPPKKRKKKKKKKKSKLYTTTIANRTNGFPLLANEHKVQRAKSQARKRAIAKTKATGLRSHSTLGFTKSFHYKNGTGDTSPYHNRNYRPKKTNQAPIKPTTLADFFSTTSSPKAVDDYRPKSVQWRRRRRPKSVQRHVQSRTAMANYAPITKKRQKPQQDDLLMHSMHVESLPDEDNYKDDVTYIREIPPQAIFEAVNEEEAYDPLEDEEMYQSNPLPPNSSLLKSYEGKGAAFYLTKHQHVEQQQEVFEGESYISPFCDPFAENVLKDESPFRHRSISPSAGLYKHDLSAEDCKSFKRCDKRCKSIEGPITHTIDGLARYLTKMFDSPVVKARSIYAWIGQHVVLETSSLAIEDAVDILRMDREKQSHKHEQASEEEIRRVMNDSQVDNVDSKEDCHRKTNAIGFANLFAELGRRAGLTVKVVQGVRKPPSFRLGKDSVDPMKNPSMKHAWNVLQINKKWFIIDCCAASGVMGLDKVYNRHYSTSFFMMSPDYAIYTHLSNSGDWQFINPPLSVQEFSALPLIGDIGNTYNIKPVNKLAAKGVIEVEETDESSIALRFALSKLNPTSATVTGDISRSTGSKLNKEIKLVHEQSKRDFSSTDYFRFFSYPGGFSLKILLPVTGTYRLTMLINQERLFHYIVHNYSPPLRYKKGYFESFQEDVLVCSPSQYYLQYGKSYYFHISNPPPHKQQLSVVIDNGFARERIFLQVDAENNYVGDVLLQLPQIETSQDINGAPIQVRIEHKDAIHDVHVPIVEYLAVDYLPLRSKMEKQMMNISASPTIDPSTPTFDELDPLDEKFDHDTKFDPSYKDTFTSIFNVPDGSTTPLSPILLNSKIPGFRPVNPVVPFLVVRQDDIFSISLRAPNDYSNLTVRIKRFEQVTLPYNIHFFDKRTLIYTTQFLFHIPGPYFIEFSSRSYLPRFDKRADVQTFYPVARYVVLVQKKEKRVPTHSSELRVEPLLQNLSKDPITIRAPTVSSLPIKYNRWYSYVIQFDFDHMHHERFKFFNNKTLITPKPSPQEKSNYQQTYKSFLQFTKSANALEIHHEENNFFRPFLILDKDIHKTHVYRAPVIVPPASSVDLVKPSSSFVKAGLHLGAFTHECIRVIDSSELDMSIRRDASLASDSLSFLGLEVRLFDFTGYLSSKLIHIREFQHEYDIRVLFPRPGTYRLSIGLKVRPSQQSLRHSHRGEVTILNHPHHPQHASSPPSIPKLSLKPISQSLPDDHHSSQLLNQNTQNNASSTATTTTTTTTPYIVVPGVTFYVFAHRGYQDLPSLVQPYSSSLLQ